MRSIDKSPYRTQAELKVAGFFAFSWDMSRNLCGINLNVFFGRAEYADAGVCALGITLMTTCGKILITNKFFITITLYVFARILQLNLIFNLNSSRVWERAAR